MVPFAKTGGLADVAGALPKALKAQGHDVQCGHAGAMAGSTASAFISTRCLRPTW